MFKSLIETLLRLLKDAAETPHHGGYTKTVALPDGVTVHEHYTEGDDTPGFREPSETTLTFELRDDGTERTTEEILQRLQAAVAAPDKKRLYPFKMVLHGNASMHMNACTITIDRPSNFDLWWKQLTNS